MKIETHPLAENSKMQTLSQLCITLSKLYMFRLGLLRFFTFCTMHLPIIFSIICREVRTQKQQQHLTFQISYKTWMKLVVVRVFAVRFSCICQHLPTFFKHLSTFACICLRSPTFFQICRGSTEILADFDVFFIDFSLDPSPLRFNLFLWKIMNNYF